MRTSLPPLSLAASALVILSGFSVAQEAPAVLSKYLKPDSPARGQIVVVEPPKEISPYVRKVEKAAQADPEWFKAFSKNSTPGVPLPFHEKLGLTKEEYEIYNKLWDERKMNPVKTAMSLSSAMTLPMSSLQPMRLVNRSSQLPQ